MTRTRCSFCRMQVRSADRECRSGACCRFRKSFCGKGVRDMVRISDARMSGTSYGTCVLHVSPESHIGGPLALVQDGDQIRLDVPKPKLDLLVLRRELEARRARWTKPAARYQRGYGALYLERVTQANRGCDFDFSRIGCPNR